MTELGDFKRLVHEPAMQRFREVVAERDRLHAALALVDDPYPPSLFAPLTENELQALCDAMNAVDPNGSARFFAYVARQRATVAREALAGSGGDTTKGANDG